MSEAHQHGATGLDAGTRHWGREPVSGIFLGMASLVAQLLKNPPAVWETWVQSLGWEDSPGGGHGNPLQDSCLENPHGQRSLAGYSPWGRKESDMPDRLHTHMMMTNPQLTPHSAVEI